jgi:hypothetical protein
MHDLDKRWGALSPDECKQKEAKHETCVIRKKRSINQSDVPGTTKSVIPILAEKGVEFLSEGRVDKIEKFMSS